LVIFSVNLKRSFIALIVAVVLAGTGWWLFGWDTVDNSALGLLRARRFFGRVTIIEGDTNRDGKINTRLVGNWSDPLNRTHARWREQWDDRNHDGNWDTWLINDNNSVTYRVDTDLDGKPDFEFTAESEEEAISIMEERRGF